MQEQVCSGKQLFRQLSLILDGHHSSTQVLLQKPRCVEFVRDIQSAILGSINAHKPSAASVETSASPESFLVVDGNLAISVSALSPIYKYAWKSFTDLTLMARSQIEQDGNDLGINSAQSDLNAWTVTIANTSQALVLVNPECYTAWNARKNLISLGQIDAMDEFHFTSLLLSKHPKSSTIWVHRYWIRSQLKESCIADLRMLDISICEKSADSYKRNYPAWTYRMKTFNLSSKDNILQELDLSRSWCKAHVSDHSGWNYRQWLILGLTGLDTNRDCISKVLAREMDLLHQLIFLCSGHESLWYHLRFASKLANLTVLDWADSSPRNITIEKDSKVDGEAISVVYGTDLAPSYLHEYQFAQMVADSSLTDREYALIYSFILTRDTSDTKKYEFVKSILQTEYPDRLMFSSM
ncbi:hypothetical protein BDV3_001033 [Batrachochytrium dendrobatidis]|nr:Protein prenyltransferase alpha subunit repeat-containing protein 1 [Batrachochytrium dendrobatidis]